MGDDDYAGWDGEPERAGAVLPFAPRSGSESARRARVDDDPWLPDVASDDDRWAEPSAYACGRDLGTMTMVVLMDDQVVDTYRRPVQGSGYECAALELGRGAPSRPPRIVEVPAQPRHEVERTWLQSRVGGVKALEDLVTEPLPDEPLDVSGVVADLRERVVAIATRVDGVAESLFGTEVRTACRRLLVRAVAAEPSLLRSSDRDDVAAGAVLHAVARANNLVGPGCAVTAAVLHQWAGLRSSPHDRARRFAHAVAGPEPLFPSGHGLERHFAARDAWHLGSADLLTSRFRRHLISLRDLADAERDRAAG